MGKDKSVHGRPERPANGPRARIGGPGSSIKKAVVERAKECGLEATVVRLERDRRAEYILTNSKGRQVFSGFSGREALAFIEGIFYGETR